MSYIIRKSVLILLFACLPVLALAATHYPKPEFSKITAVDTKKRIVILYGKVYYMSRSIRVHDVGNKFPSIRDLKAGMEIKFRTIKSRKNNRVEVREIWIIPR